MYKYIASVVPTQVMKDYPSKFNPGDHHSYVANTVSLEGVLSVAGLLCPNVVSVEDYIFWVEDETVIQEMVKKGIETRIPDNLLTNPKQVERYLNNFNISYFFLDAFDASAECEKLFKISVQVIEYYWMRRLHELFPNKEFEFEHHPQGLFGEPDYCVTFSQK